MSRDCVLKRKVISSLFYTREHRPVSNKYNIIQ